MKKILTLFLLIYTANLTAQNPYRSPLDIPLLLGANFGELRPNHFHSGIDLKTQGVINKPVYAMADGYISRISVSPTGYGLALYINYPATKQTGVYGHINKFAPKIAAYIKEKQYEKESYTIDISLNADEIPVKRGDMVAYSGNTGSSGGPHVHFEIRNTENRTAIDALEYCKTDIEDTQAPLLKGIAVYPLNEKGAVDFSRDPYRRSVPVLKDGGYASLKDTAQVWGRIGVGVYANDKMTGTTNIYGVRKVRLFCDDKEIYSSDMSVVDFAKTRMINSLIDYDYWSRTKIFYQKSFIEPGNKLPIYKAVNNGYIDINEERIYNFRYELEDLYGNKTTYPFCVEGREQTIPLKKRCFQTLLWNQDNGVLTDKFSLVVPKDYLYDNVCFTLKNNPSRNYLSDVFEVNDTHVPLHGFCDMSLKLNKDTLSNKAQYGIVHIVGSRERWVGGAYKNGYVTGRIGELGNTYAVSVDTKAPTITPLQPERWVRQSEIKIRLSDNKSGVAASKGTIDGAFVLFENDVKSSVYSYKFDPSRLKKGQSHQFVFTATDACGNTASYEYSFKY
ncbi:MAG: M23 family metallopeptidase [Prevotella sp.]|jgi:hypothetical protein|nr:M23 family metallopeptidase [Prevotella sp.]